MRYYVAELEREGFLTVLVSAPPDVADVVRGISHPDAAMFVVDVMMPPGGLYRDDVTQSGLYTGICVARDLRERYPNTPIILLSQAPFGEVQESAKRSSKRNPNFLFLRKIDTLPHELAFIVRSYFESGRFKRSVWKKLWGAVTLRPSFGGVGLDLKQLK